MAKGSYIFESKEWVLTGRDAVKILASGKEKKLIEIKPIEITDPDDNSFNKWVSPEVLYHVNGLE